MTSWAARRADRHFSVDLQRPYQSLARAARVIRLRYHPGQFFNALNPESSIRNENLWIGLEEESPPYRRIVVRQIAGLLARRIVCNLRPGEATGAGQQVWHDQAGLAHRTDRGR